MANRTSKPNRMAEARSLMRGFKSPEPAPLRPHTRLLRSAGERNNQGSIPTPSSFPSEKMKKNCCASSPSGSPFRDDRPWRALGLRVWHGGVAGCRLDTLRAGSPMLSCTASRMPYRGWAWHNTFPPVSRDGRLRGFFSTAAASSCLVPISISASPARFLLPPPSPLLCLRHRDLLRQL
jgi:hypothetical protein